MEALDAAGELAARQTERVALLDEGIATLQAAIEKARSQANAARIAESRAVFARRLEKARPTLVAFFEDLAAIRALDGNPTWISSLEPALSKFFANGDTTSTRHLDQILSSGKARAAAIRAGTEATP